jgi:hypothetical protein
MIGRLLWTRDVQNPADFAIVVTAFVLLVAWRVPALLMVFLSASTGAALRQMT